MASHKPYQTAFWVTLFLMSLLKFFFSPYFFTNDDTAMLFIAKGVGSNSAPGEFILFQNILVGLFLKELYILVPSIQWYTWFLILAQSFGLWALLSCLFLGSSSFFKFLLFLLSFSSMDIFYFTHLQWSVSAGLAAQGGIFLIGSLPLAKLKENIWPGLLLSGTCLLLAALIRVQVLILTFFCLIPWLIWAFRNKEFKFRLNSSPSKFCIGLLLTILFFNAFDKFYLSQNPDWREFSRFNYARSMIYDDNNLIYTPQTKPYFDSVHWSRNDFSLFMAWYFMDKEKYNVQNFQELLKHFPLPCSVRSGYRSTPEDTLAFEKIFLLPRSQFLMVCFFSFFVLVSTRKLWMVSFLAFWVLLVLFLLTFVRTPEWVFMPLLSLIVFQCLNFIEWPQSISGVNGKFNYFEKFKICVLIFPVLSLVPSLGFERQVNFEQKNDEVLFKSSLQALNPKADELYVTWAGDFPFQYWSALDNFENIGHLHLFELGSFQRSPYSARLMESFGLKNLFKDMVDNKKIFIVCSIWHAGLLSRYLWDNFHLIVGGKAVFSGYKFNVYQVYSVRKL